MSGRPMTSKQGSDHIYGILRCPSVELRAYGLEREAQTASSIVHRASLTGGLEAGITFHRM